MVATVTYLMRFMTYFQIQMASIEHMCFAMLVSKNAGEFRFVITIACMWNSFLFNFTLNAKEITNQIIVEENLTDYHPYGVWNSPNDSFTCCVIGDCHFRSFLVALNNLTSNFLINITTNVLLPSAVNLENITILGDNSPTVFYLGGLEILNCKTIRIENVGILWKQRYYIDTCLPFSLRSAPHTYLINLLMPFIGSLRTIMECSTYCTVLKIFLQLAQLILKSASKISPTCFPYVIRSTSQWREKRLKVPPLTWHCLVLSWILWRW